MAYKYSGAIPCADRFVAFKTLRDFLCNRNSYQGLGPGGWSLWDSYYVSGNESVVADYDWCVVKSSGTSGYDDMYIYIRVDPSALTTFAYVYWDPSTNTGVTQWCNAGNQVNCLGINYVWIYADDDVAVIITRDNINTRYYGATFGCLESIQPRSFHPLLTVSGTSGTVANSAKDFLAAGSYTYVVANRGSSSFARRFQVASNDGSGNLVFTESLATYSVLVGDLLTPCIPQVCQNSNTIFLNRSTSAVVCRMVGGSSVTANRADNQSSLMGAADPDSDGMVVASRIPLYSTAGIVGRLPAWIVEVSNSYSAAQESTIKLIDQNINFRFFNIFNSSCYIFLRED